MLATPTRSYYNVRFGSPARHSAIRPAAVCSRQRSDTFPQSANPRRPFHVEILAFVRRPPWGIDFRTRRRLAAVAGTRPFQCIDREGARESVAEGWRTA